MTKGQEIVLEWHYALAELVGDKRIALAADIDAALTERTKECAEAACEAYHDAANGCAAITSAILAVDRPKPKVWCDEGCRDPIKFIGGAWFTRYGKAVPDSWEHCPHCGRSRPL